MNAAMPGPIRTQSGLLSGIPGNDPSVTVYKGVPFAAPPVGDLRWKAPQPPASWPGVRKADHFGNICPQRVRPGSSDPPVSEDCLYLNVWSGAKSSAEKRPVFVWFFGGGYTVGSGSQPDFDGEGLARKGLIVVTMNYRLGILGFLASPELSAESNHHASGNYAVLDKIACLEWVKKNIASFGGDPTRVMIAGQSSGAESVNLLLISPLAKGLFQRALAESGARFPSDPAFRGHPVYWASVEEAEAAGVKFTQAQGVHSVKELRAIRWEDLKMDGLPLEEYRPYFDGWVFPQGFQATYAKGLQNDVPLMMGFNRDELLGPPERMPVQTLEGYRDLVGKIMGPFAGEFMKLYPASSDSEAVQAHLDTIRDAHRTSLFLLASDWKKAAHSPVFTYFWTHAPAGRESNTRDPKGVYHGSEINYFFDNLYSRNLSWDDEDRKIAEIMSTYLVNFATNGNPNGPDLQKWPEFNANIPVTMELGDHFKPIPVASDEKLQLIKRYFLAQKPQ